MGIGSRGVVYVLPTRAVAQFVQRAVQRFVLSGGYEVVRFSVVASVVVVTVVIDGSSRVDRRVRR